MADAPTPADLRQAEALLRRGEGAGFAEPWQAEAFACTLQLSRQGLFTWAEWVAVFSAEIKTAPVRAGESHNEAYYRQWLTALERIVGQKGAASPAEIDTRQEAWRQAYLNTPHGAPVELANARARRPRRGIITITITTMMTTTITTTPRRNRWR